MRRARTINERRFHSLVTMKSLSFVATLLGLLAGPCSALSVASLPADFKPPPVFKNNNLVHVVSVEKSFAREQINVLVENVSGKPQDEYFVPFTADQIARLGGIEAKDRKDDTIGPFGVDRVEYSSQR